MKASFHSTKEGFKAASSSSTERAINSFPFHQGRFQGVHSSYTTEPMEACFHSTKEGFKVAGHLGGDPAPADVSIPPRKVSRLDGLKNYRLYGRVSIPPRKVSRFCHERIHDMDKSRFHSTKEGFKASQPGGAAAPEGVSIPPRKVSRAVAKADKKSAWRRFHSTKEGFKVCRLRRGQGMFERFPFHQGRFQGRAAWGRRRRTRPRFHSTKEGFKEELDRGGAV